MYVCMPVKVIYPGRCTDFANARSSIMGGNLLSNNFVLFYILEAHSRRLQVVIALQLKWQPQFTSVDPIVRALSPSNSNSLPICPLPASVSVPSRFTPTVPGYATCRLIDNDVNKIDAMEASRTSSIATTRTTTAAARRRTKGRGRGKGVETAWGQGQQQKRTNKKQFSSRAAT